MGWPFREVLAQVKVEIRRWIQHQPRTALRDPKFQEGLREPGKTRWKAVLSELEEWEENLEPGSAPPDRPENRAPADGTTVEGRSIDLETAPYSSGGLPSRHGWTRWLVKPPGLGFWNPTFDLLTREHLTRLVLPEGLLLSDTDYTWIAVHLSADGRVSQYSLETRFTTGDLGYEPLPVDLSAVFNKDVVPRLKNPGAPAASTTSTSLNFQGTLRRSRTLLISKKVSSMAPFSV